MCTKDFQNQLLKGFEIRENAGIRNFYERLINFLYKHIIKCIKLPPNSTMG